MQKISIITVNFNNLSGLKKTIDSVLAQRYADIEYIIIDGGSTDGSRELIEYHSKRLSYWCSEPDKGIYDGMNKGIAKATGEYCLFLNSGDYFCNDHVLQDVFAEEQITDLVIGRQKFYTVSGKTSIAWSICEEDINERFFWSNTFPHQSTFIKASLLKRVGGYDLDYKVCADWAFWYIAVVEEKCSYKCIATPISMMEDGGVSRDMDKCRADMGRFLMQHHPVMTMEDWADINGRYTEALGYRRSNMSVLSRLLMKVTTRINKK